MMKSKETKVMKKVTKAKGAKPSKIVESPDSDEDWRGEHDLRTLKESEKIESDPVRMKKAGSLAKKEMESLEKLMRESKWGK